MTDYIAQTSDKRNISYIDDDQASVWRRAINAGMKVVRVITLEQYHTELYGPEYQAEVVTIHEQAKLNFELNKAVEDGAA